MTDTYDEQVAKIEGKTDVLDHVAKEMFFTKEKRLYDGYVRAVHVMAETVKMPQISEFVWKFQELFPQHSFDKFESATRFSVRQKFATIADQSRIFYRFLVLYHGKFLLVFEESNITARYVASVMKVLREFHQEYKKIERADKQLAHFVEHGPHAGRIALEFGAKANGLFTSITNVSIDGAHVKSCRSSNGLHPTIAMLHSRAEALAFLQSFDFL